MADSGSIKVKLILDTTPYMEAMARVRAALAELASVQPQLCTCECKCGNRPKP